MTMEAMTLGEEQAVHPWSAAAPEPQESGPIMIKRNLRARDIKRLGRIIGQIQGLAREEFKGAAAVNQAMVMQLIFSDGLEIAEREINLWVADLCNIEPEGVPPNASEQAREDALIEQIANMDLTVYSQVLEDLADHGSLGSFLTQAIRVWRRFFPATPTSTGSESTPSNPDTDGQTNT